MTASEHLHFGFISDIDLDLYPTAISGHLRGMPCTIYLDRGHHPCALSEFLNLKPLSRRNDPELDHAIRNGIIIRGTLPARHLRLIAVVIWHEIGPAYITKVPYLHDQERDEARIRDAASLNSYIAMERSIAEDQFYFSDLTDAAWFRLAWS